jgi:hypothetical protein
MTPAERIRKEADTFGARMGLEIAQWAARQEMGVAQPALATHLVRLTRQTLLLLADEIESVAPAASDGKEKQE